MKTSKTNKPLVRMASLFIFFLFFCVNQDLRGQSTYSVPICTFWSSGNAPQGGYGIYVKQVTVAGINKSTTGGAGASRNYTSITGSVEPGGSYSVTLGYPSTAYSSHMGMWVDWNDDGDFSDANEEVKPWTTNTLSSAGTHSFTMNVPAGASLTSVRMRVMNSNSNTVAACGGYFWGENEEYELVVSAGCSVGSASSSPSVIQNTAMTNITHATEDVTGVTSSTGLPAGVTASYSSDVLTISGTPTATGTFNYTIDLDGCGDDATGTITVSACTVGSASSTPTIMKDVAMTNITHATEGVTGVTSSTGLPSGVTASYSSDVLTISGTPTATGTFNYTIDLAGCGDDATGTIIVVDEAPGGYPTNLLLWLKADAQTYEDASPGTDAAEDADDILQWHDQSGLSHDATVATSSYPHYDEDGINFNPSLTFTKASSEYLAIEDGLFGTETKDQITAYTVTTHDASQTANFQSPVFSEELAGSNEWFRYLGDWSTNGLWWQLGSSSDGSGRCLDGTHVDIKHGRPIISSLGSGNSNSTSAGEEQYIRIDGNLEKTQSGYDASATGNNSDFKIGKYGTDTDEHDGNIAEIIIYDGIPSAVEEIQIQSYLAVKYGITLSDDNDADASAGETVSGSITEGDYVDSDGSTVIWNYSAYSSYHYDIAGIGRDDIQGLNQKQSKSANSDAIVTISTEAIGTTNAGISTTLTDGTYLLWGNNNASTSAETDMPSGYTGRLEKEWVVEMTGTVSNVHVEFDLGELHNLAGDGAGDYYLLIDSDGDFTSGASETAASTLTGNNKITFNDINFTDGYYFTLGTKQSAPGGVGTHLQAWWKADAGTATTTDDASNASWTDQSSHGFVANQTTTGADYWENGINFNPVLRFTGSNEDFTVTNGIYGNTTRDNMFTYVVCTRAATGAAHNVISQELLSSYLYGMLFYSNNYTFYYEGNNLETTGRISNIWGGTVDQPHLWVGGAAESASTPGGNFKYLMRDNTMYDNTTGTSTVSGGTNDLVIGSGHDGAGDYNGDIAEIIILDGIPSALEEDQIQSYLAIKYGITLASSDYYNSAGTVVWDNSTYSAYHYDVAGIGRDDNGTLLQKQSKSINSDAIVTMSTEAIAADNDANSTTLTDGTYLLWGNNDASSANHSDVPSADYTRRLYKEWVVEMTGTVADVHIEFDLSNHLYLSGNSASNFYLLIDGDGDFTSGVASETAASSLSGNKVTFDNVNFTDGQYFTLATKQSAGPGGVSDHLRLWLKADGSTNTTTEDADVTAWGDQSTNVYDAEDAGSNPPSYKTNAINFNPALDFDGSEDIEINGGITTGTNSLTYFFYVVSKRETDGATNTVFRQNLVTQSSVARWLIFRHVSTGGYAADFYYGGGTDGTGRHRVTWDNSAVQPHLWSFGSSRDDANTPNGTKQYIQLDNTTIDYADNGGSVAGSSTNAFHIGASGGTTEFYDGLIAEIICLDDIPTDEEDLKIKTYLALKYGISLGATTDLKNSAGTVIWDKDHGDGTYTNDISAIGRDDASGFNQKQSKSINSDGIMTMSTQSTIAASNAANTTQLSNDLSFEMWANNNGSVAVQADNSGTAHNGTVFNETIPRKWLIQETGTVGAVTIELDLTGSTFTSPDAQKMALVFDNDGGFDGSGEESFTIADTYDAGTKKLTFNSVDLTDGKYVSLMKSVSVLPVELLSFNVEAEGCFARITWSTASEINNDYFSIEYSYDGVDWTEIDKVYGAGNSNEVIHYSHYDFDCFHNQLVYYRIVQVDFDGTRSSSKVKPLNVVQPYTVKIFPNPTKGNTTVEINAEFGDRTGNVVVRTMSGQKVFSKSIVNGKNQLNLKRLAPDTYIIKVSAPDQLPYYEKLVILK